MFRLPLWHWLLGRAVAHIYYRVRVRGRRTERPTLFIGSHRNGAIDGYVAMPAIGRTPTLISVQLLRFFWQRCLFSGIPVVREKDRVRFGMDKSAVPSPLMSAAAVLKAGGDVCLFPEGSSEWQERPLPYQGGMGVLAAKLRAAGVDFVVQPFGIFYSRPDAFRSRVSVVLGPAFVPEATTARAAQAELAAALAALSVNCPNRETFNRVESAAFAAAQAGADYGEAFLAAQADPPQEMAIYPPRSRFTVLAKAAFALAFWPAAGAALLAQKWADGRNTVCFFRVIGAFAALPLLLGYWGVLAFVSPVLLLLVILIGVAGWFCYSEPQPRGLS